MWMIIGLLIPVSILYLRGWGTAAPIYWGGGALVAAALTVASVRARGLRKPPRSYCVLVVLAFYLAVSDWARGEPITPNSGNLGLGVAAALLVFMSPAAHGHIRWIRRGVVAALVMIAADRVVQFTPWGMPFYEDGVVPDAGAWYYSYKASYLAGDANSIGLFLLPLYALLWQVTERRAAWMRAFEYALQVMTFSKASIGSVVVRDGLAPGMRWSTRVAGVITIVGLVGWTLSTGVDLGRSLNSGVVKWNTFGMFVDVIAQADLSTAIWGAGSNSALPSLGIYLHAWPLTALYETGIVGLVLMLLYLVFSAIESKRIFWVLHIPVFLVAGWSFLFYLGGIWLYLPHYVLYVLDRESGDATRTGVPRKALAEH